MKNAQEAQLRKDRERQTGEREWNGEKEERAGKGIKFGGNLEVKVEGEIF